MWLGDYGTSLPKGHPNFTNTCLTAPKTSQTSTHHLSYDEFLASRIFDLFDVATMSRRPPNPAAERAAQNQLTIKSLLKLEANKICADCKRNKRKLLSVFQTKSVMH